MRCVGQFGKKWKCWGLLASHLCTESKPSSYDDDLMCLSMQEMNDSDDDNGNVHSDNVDARGG